MKALSVKNLSKTYANQHKALKGINLDVAAGDFFALLGPNGAGKSTFIGILTDLVVKTTGEVSVFGFDKATHPTEVKKCLGVVPQEFNFSDHNTLKATLLFQAGLYGVNAKQAKKQCEFLLKEMGLWKKRNDLVRALSGGMKRRLMIARALMHSPKLLLLDEPSAGVDIELRHHMWHFIRQLNEMGTSIILTTHYLEEAENLCKNIAIIDEGKLVKNTSMASLLSELECEVFILNLEDPLQQAPENLPYTVLFNQEAPSILEVNLPLNSSMSDLISTLHAHNIRVKTVHQKSNRLETLFLTLTGTGAQK